MRCSLQELSFTAVAATMAVGQVEFEAGLADGGEEKSILAPGNEAVASVAQLLQVDADALRTALVTRQIHARGESYEIALTVAQSVDAKDALGKALYAKLFDWLVGVINVSTQPKDIKQVRCCSLSTHFAHVSLTFCSRFARLWPLSAGRVHDRRA